MLRRLAGRALVESRASVVHSFVFLSLVVSSLVLFPPGILGAAEEAAESWQPRPPMPYDYDWIQLTSGEWLKGEFIAMYQETLEFDSDKLDLLKLDWDDVREVRSAGTMQVGFGRTLMAVGQIYIDGDTLRVLGDKELEFPRSQIVTITAGEPREINFWSFKASLGANVRRGNTEQIETTGQLNIIRRTPLNRINLEYLATYNETEGLTAADNQRATASWSRYRSTRFFWIPIYGEWFRDPFQNIASRWSVGGGAGYEIIDTSKVEWAVLGGPAYQGTRFQDVAEGDSTDAETPALVISTTYEHELKSWLDFLFDYRFFLVDEDSGTYTHHMVGGIELDITSLVDLDIKAIWDRTRDPQPDSEGNIPEQDDLRLVVALGLDF
jgi:hypothetical protein